MKGILINQPMFAFVELDSPQRPRVQVIIHGATRREFDALPGKVEVCPRPTDRQAWRKQVSPAIVVFTHEPPDDEDPSAA